MAKRRIESQDDSSEVAVSPTEMAKIENKENLDETKIFGK